MNTKEMSGSVQVCADLQGHASRDAFLCAFIVLACVLLSDPLANMSFVDDFSYARTALEFARTGHFFYNGWAVEILGWLVPWGAIFIKLFGFSFNVLRISMLPVDMAVVYLFHQILTQFGIRPLAAISGTLTLALSPLFLPLAASYMTDIPGLLVILGCLYMCQRAVAASSDGVALLWLYCALFINVTGGMVRQISWLGALVMVPSTAWFMRERRGMKLTAVLSSILSVLGVLACMHWFSMQPYSVPEHIFTKPITWTTPLHLAAQYLKTLLCLLLVIFPVTVGWLGAISQLSLKAKQTIALIMGALVCVAILLYKHDLLGGWAMPWLTPVLVWQEAQIPGVWNLSSSTVKALTRISLSLLVILPGLIIAARIWKGHARSSPRQAYPQRRRSMDAMLWMIGPFSCFYILLLAPRGSFTIIQDRYILGLVPMAIIVITRLYQDHVAQTFPVWTFGVLAFVALYSVAGTHDIYSQSRAIVRAVEMLRNSGVRRSEIEAGLASDGWFQTEHGGHLNDYRIENPPGAYRPYTYEMRMPPQCRYEFAKLMSAIAPVYFVLPDPLPCFSSTHYPPVEYERWLPPFRGILYVQKLRDSSM